MNAYRWMLYVHWKAARWPLALCTLISFSLPLFMMRLMEVPRSIGYEFDRSTAEDMIMVEQSFLPMFPLLAIVTGVTIALTAWTWDHQSRHVYALSLPVSRGRYSLLKMGGGFALLMLPVLALLIGSLLGLAMTPLPPELYAYPFQFVLRFLLAVLIIYAATFTLASSTLRTTILILGGFVIVVIFGTIAVEYLKDALNDHTLVTPFEVLHDAFLYWPGPFSVFGGSWMLIDA